MRRLFDPVSVNPNRTLLEEGSFAGAMLSLLLAVSALLAGINAIKQGERSWVVWVSLVLPAIVRRFGFL